MLRSSLSVAALAVLVAAAPAFAQEGKPAAGNRRNFVSCPVVRDTKTVPCFLAEYDGEMYFLGIQEDIGAAWFPPQLNHQVLVEGVVSNEPRICGGIVLKPLVTSVMPELDTSCNTILPAEDQYEVHGHRGPGPSSEERRAPLPGPTPPAPAAVATTFSPKDFTVTFDFDNDFMPGRITRNISDAVRYAKTAKAKKVSVMAYRATTLLSNGHPLVESPLIAERRAKKLEAILIGLGIPQASLDIKWKTEPEAGDGISDPQKRRAVITVTP